MSFAAACLWLWQAPPSVGNLLAVDRKRTAYVVQAFANGADCIGVGTPIHNAIHPCSVAESIQPTIAEVLASR